MVMAVYCPTWLSMEIPYFSPNSWRILWSTLAIPTWRKKSALFFDGFWCSTFSTWQVYMVPQFIMMRGMGMNDTHMAIICLQAFSAFGVFMMRQFYQGIPDELCEAARIDGLNEFGIFRKIVFPLGKPAMATLTIFTFTNVWNDFMGPLIYLKTKELKTVQLGIRMFISQYGADYAWIMAASVCSLIPIVIVFLSCQKFFVEGVAASGIKDRRSDALWHRHLKEL